MFSIGEFSRITSLSIKTLRFYHEKGLLIPASVDAGSGYRHYNQANVERARVIAALRSLEFSLEEIGVILTDCSDQEDLLENLDRRRETVIAEIRRQQDIASMLDFLIRSEKEARLAMKNSTFDVEEKTMDPVLVAGMRMTGRYSECGKGFSQLGKLVGRYIFGKPMCLYYDDDYREDDADMEPCFPIRKKVQADGVSVRELPGGRCVSVLHRGPYQQLGRSYEKAMQYTKEHGYQITRPTREVYIKGPGMIFRGNPKKYLTEIQLPIESGASQKS